MDDSCIFCKISSKEIETDIVFESENVIVFHDREPSAEKHFLVVPKKHIVNFLDLTEKELIWEMDEIMRKLVIDNNLNSSGYKVLFNGGYYQHVQHVHWHLLGGKMLIK
ncbi:HIT domain-containing protein [Candidatus Curtissbacteria bacterium]|nr:HIT domain-containing protein [Candidatus Curtissbacteria bacterium]